MIQAYSKHIINYMPGSLLNLSHNGLIHGRLLWCELELVTCHSTISHLKNAKVPKKKYMLNLKKRSYLSL